MSLSKTPYWLFGATAGIAIAAALIGLLLVGTAAVVELRADSGYGLTLHPLFVSGFKLITTSLMTGLPLLALGYLWRKQ